MPLQHRSTQDAEELRQHSYPCSVGLAQEVARDTRSRHAKPDARAMGLWSKLSLSATFAFNAASILLSFSFVLIRSSLPRGADYTTRPLVLISVSTSEEFVSAV